MLCREEKKIVEEADHIIASLTELLNIINKPNK